MDDLSQGSPLSPRSMEDEVPAYEQPPEPVPISRVVSNDPREGPNLFEMPGTNITVPAVKVFETKPVDTLEEQKESVHKELMRQREMKKQQEEEQKLEHERLKSIRQANNQKKKERERKKAAIERKERMEIEEKTSEFISNLMPDLFARSPSPEESAPRERPTEQQEAANTKTTLPSIPLIEISSSSDSMTPPPARQGQVETFKRPLPPPSTTHHSKSIPPTPSEEPLQSPSKLNLRLKESPSSSVKSADESHPSEAAKMDFMVPPLPQSPLTVGRIAAQHHQFHPSALPSKTVHPLKLRSLLEARRSSIVSESSKEKQLPLPDPTTPTHIRKGASPAKKNQWTELFVNTSPTKDQPQPLSALRRLLLAPPRSPPQHEIQQQRAPIDEHAQELEKTMPQMLQPVHPADSAIAHHKEKASPLLKAARPPHPRPDSELQVLEAPLDQPMTPRSRPVEARRRPHAIPQPQTRHRSTPVLTENFRAPASTMGKSSAPLSQPHSLQEARPARPLDNSAPVMPSPQLAQQTRASPPDSEIEVLEAPQPSAEPLVRPLAAATREPMLHEILSGIQETVEPILLQPLDAADSDILIMLPPPLEEESVVVIEPEQPEDEQEPVFAELLTAAELKQLQEKQTRQHEEPMSLVAPMQSVDPLESQEPGPTDPVQSVPTARPHRPRTQWRKMTAREKGEALHMDEEPTKRKSKVISVLFITSEPISFV